MKHAHHYFRVLSEARLCHMDGSQAPEKAEPKPETKSEQPKGEAFIQIEDADSSKSVGDKAQDAMDKRTGDLGKALEDMGTTVDTSKESAADVKVQSQDVQRGIPVPPAPEGKGRTPRGNADKRAKIRAEEEAAKSSDAKEPQAKTIDVNPINTPKPNVIKPKPSFAPSATTKEDPGLVQAPDVPPAPDAAPAGAAGDDKVAGDKAAEGGKDEGKGEKPAEEKKEDAVEGAKDAAADATEAAGDTAEKSDVQNALSKLGEAAKGKDFGAFLAALKEVMDSIKTIFKPEAKKDEAKDAANAPGTTPDNKGNTPNAGPSAGPSAGPTEGGNRPTEATGEKPSDRTDRLKKEVSDAGSVVEFKKNKEGSRNQKMDDFDKEIDTEQADIQKLDAENGKHKQDIADAEQKLSDPRTTDPKEKGKLQDTIRDLTVDVEANNKKIDNNRKDIQENTAQRNEVFANTESDIKEVDGMLKKATDGKASIDKMLTGMRETKNLTTNEEMKTLLAGITVDVVESKLDIGISLSDPAKAALDNLVKQAGGSTEGVFGPGGVVQNTEKLQAAIAVAVTDLAKKAQAEAKKA